MHSYEVTINNKPYHVIAKKYTPEQAELVIDGQPFLVNISSQVQSGMFVPVAEHISVPVASFQPTSAAKGDIVSAPIPGTIIDILMNVGDRVEKGQVVMKIEAMKMENEINANISGTVLTIDVKAGDAVNQDQKLMEIA